MKSLPTGVHPQMALQVRCGVENVVAQPALVRAFLRLQECFGRWLGARRSRLVAAALRMRRSAHFSDHHDVIFIVVVHQLRIGPVLRRHADVICRSSTADPSSSSTSRLVEFERKGCDAFVVSSLLAPFAILINNSARGVASRYILLSRGRNFRWTVGRWAGVIITQW